MLKKSPHQQLRSNSSVVAQSYTIKETGRKGIRSREHRDRDDSLLWRPVLQLRARWQSGAETAAAD